MKMQKERLQLNVYKINAAVCCLFILNYQNLSLSFIRILYALFVDGKLLF